MIALMIMFSVVLIRIKTINKGLYLLILDGKKDLWIDRPGWAMDLADNKVMFKFFDAIEDGRCDDFLVIKNRSFYRALYWSYWLSGLVFMCSILAQPFLG